MPLAGGHLPADRGAGIRGLWLESLATEVVGALRDRGVRPVLLKGPALERLLYEPGESRGHGDVDLLVAPGSLVASEAAMRELGFEPLLTDADFPGHAPLHGHPWSRPGGAVPALVDLHTTLPEAHAPRERAWSALTRRTRTIRLAGGDVETLSVAGHALHVALHAVHHGAGALRPLADLARALDRLDRGVWEEAASLAGEVGAGEGMSAGLRLAGATELARELRLPDAADLELTLKAASAPKLALGMMRLQDAGGATARARLIARALLPSAAWLRNDSRLARRGRLGLAAAYVAFPLRVLAQLPAAVLALTRARRGRSPAGSPPR